MKDFLFFSEVGAVGDVVVFKDSKFDIRFFYDINNFGDLWVFWDENGDFLRFFYFFQVELGEKERNIVLQCLIS